MRIDGVSTVAEESYRLRYGAGFDVPLVSVGAHNPGGLNPTGPTVSVYSNTGSWVTAYRCGTAVAFRRDIAPEARPPVPDRRP